MKKMIKIAALTTAAFISSAHAGESEIRKALNLASPSASIDSVKATEIDGLYEVMVGSDILYMSEDGKYLLQGHLIDLAARKDLTEAKLAHLRVEAIDKVGEDQTIIFKPEDSRYKVSVFTDIDCGYCRKLHSEIDQYLAEGITVQYLFYPRAGKGSESYKKAVSVWCAEDRNAALTSAKQGKTPEAKECDNPVDAHMALGTEFGARGTPMIVTEKGTILPGYVPAKQLAKALAAEQ